MRINEITEKDDLFYVFRDLEKNCSDFIKDMKTARRFLWRGISGYDQDVYTEISPTNRKPNGQTPMEQATLDSYLMAAGFQSLRSNSICCATDYDGLMGSYVYIIFPHDGYSFTWSSKIKDIGGTPRLRQFLSQKHWGTLEQESERLIAELDFRDRDMVSALKSGAEITIHGKYTAINESYSNQLSRYFRMYL